MKTRILWNLLLLTAIFWVSSCSDDSAQQVSKIELTTEAGTEIPVFVVPEQPVELKYMASNATTVSAGTLPEGWSAEVDQTTNTVEVTATVDAVRLATLTLTATGGESQDVTATVNLYCLNSFDDPNGTFVLNEGNMTTENGSLTYISPEGYVVDDSYKTVNGTELGNVAQDMAFYNGKIYVITQNGDENPNGTKFENDGMLIVMNAKTLKKEKAFSKEQLSTLNWPTHIAVLDEQHVYIRDKNNLFRADISNETPTLTTISELTSKDVPTSPFVVLNGKVYTAKNRGRFLTSIYVITPENDTATELKSITGTPKDLSTIYTMQASEDGKIWLLGWGAGNIYTISKFDPETKTIAQQQLQYVPVPGMSTGNSSGKCFAAHENTVYYTEAETMNICRVTFDDNAAGATGEESTIDLSGLDDNAGQLYNGLGVHPVTGHVWINTIKSYALFTQNQIWDFAPAKFGAESPAADAKYENYTNFPAGFFFPASKVNPE